MTTTHLSLYFSILMQWAEGGSLEELIENRMGKPHQHQPHPSGSNSNDSLGDSGSEDIRSRSSRIRAFRKRQHASSSERREQMRRKQARATPAVHLFNAMEIKGLFSDIVNGLGFLVSIIPETRIKVLIEISTRNLFFILI